MTRLQWLWLLIWIFIFFTLFCTWDKTNRLYPALNAVQSGEAKTAQLAQIDAQKIEKKPTQIAVQKRGNVIEIWGTIARQNDKDEIVDLFTSEYTDLNASKLHVDKGTQRDLFIVDLLSTLAEDFLHFRNGIIYYNGNQIDINGTTDNSVTKGSINKKVTLLKQKGIEVEESIRLIDLDAEGERANMNDINQSEINASLTDQNSSCKDATLKSPAALFQALPIASNHTADHNRTQATSPEENMTQMRGDINTSTSNKIQQKLDAIMHNQRIEFLYAKDRLNKKSRQLLDKIATILQQAPRIKIEIGGHTDSDGTAKRNLALSKRRAEAVKRYLVRQGIVPDRIKAVGYGESKPLYPNDTKEHKQRNRRVEFKVMGEKE